MGARTIAFVGSRLFAIYVFVAYVLNYVMLLVGAFSPSDVGRQILGDVSILTVSMVLSALIAAGFWFGAGLVADGVVNALPVSDETELNIDQWKALVVAAIGALCVFTSIRVFAQCVRLLYSSGDRNFTDVAFGGVFYAIIGCGMIAGSSSVVRGIKALRAWFSKPAFSGDDQ